MNSAPCFHDSTKAVCPCPKSNPHYSIGLSAISPFADNIGNNVPSHSLLPGKSRLYFFNNMRFLHLPPFYRNADDATPYLRCLSFGTTQVPLARQTTIGSSNTSQAESLISVLGTITLRASNTIFLDVFPTETISPTASM